jgi:hypothetical protein
MTTASRATVLAGNAIVDAAKKLRRLISGECAFAILAGAPSMAGSAAITYTTALGAPTEKPISNTFLFYTVFATQS